VAPVWKHIFLVKIKH